MIAYLRGKITDIFDNTIILEVNGVGYRVDIPQGIFLEGEEAELFIHTALRENDLSLWGFPTKKDLRMFTILLGVNGVGLRTAQSLIFNLGTEKIASAVKSNSPTSLKVPGIGKKTSEKIVIDLRDKLNDIDTTDLSDGSVSSLSESNSKLIEDAIQAVERLGYKRSEAMPVIEQLVISEYDSPELLLKAILIHI